MISSRTSMPSRPSYFWNGKFHDQSWAAGNASTTRPSVWDDHGQHGGNPAVARSFIHAAANGAPPRGFHQRVDRTLMFRSDHTFSVLRRGFRDSRGAIDCASAISDGPVGNGSEGSTDSASTKCNNFGHPSLGTCREGSEKGASIAAAKNCPSARRYASLRKGDPLPTRRCIGFNSVTRGLRSLPHLTRQIQTFDVARSARHDRTLPEKSIPKNSITCVCVRFRAAHSISDRTLRRHQAPLIYAKCGLLALARLMRTSASSGCRCLVNSKYRIWPTPLALQDVSLERVHPGMVFVALASAKDFALDHKLALRLLG